VSESLTPIVVEPTVVSVVELVVAEVVGSTVSLVVASDSEPEPEEFVVVGDVVVGDVVVGDVVVGDVVVGLVELDPEALGSVVAESSPEHAPRPIARRRPSPGEARRVERSVNVRAMREW